MASSSAGGGASDDTPAPTIESQAAFDQLLSRSDVVLVDFYAEWCGPCRLMEDIVAELAGETDVPVVRVDVETLPEVTMRYDVGGLPAFVAFEDGAPAGRLVGMQDKTALRELIE